MTLPEDKRKFVRIAKKYIISVKPVDIYEELCLKSGRKIENSLFSESKNISACGILISSPVSYSVGTIIKLEITLDDWQESEFSNFTVFDQLKKSGTFKTVARVVRTHKERNHEFELGLEFIGVNAEQQKSLNRYMLKHFPKGKIRDE